MKTVNLIQGTPEWHDFRQEHYPASEAPAVMKASKWHPKTPEELAMLRLGIKEKEISGWQQRLFQQGHEMESAARPLVEQHILNGDPLSPMIGVDENDYGLKKKLSASLDGITFDGETIFEHKKWSESLAHQVKTGELEDHYRWQLDQQLLVTGAKRVIFVVSDSAEITEFDYDILKDDLALVSEPFEKEGERYRYAAQNFLWMEYFPDEKRFEALIEGWRHYEEVEETLLTEDPELIEAAKSYAALHEAIEEHKARIKELEKLAAPFKEHLIRSAKNADSDCMVAGSVQVKRVERKGSLNIELLKEHLDDEVIEACRNEPNIIWQVVIDKKAAPVDANTISAIKSKTHPTDEDLKTHQDAQPPQSRRALFIPGSLRF